MESILDIKIQQQWQQLDFHRNDAAISVYYASDIVDLPVSISTRLKLLNASHGEKNFLRQIVLSSTFPAIATDLAAAVRTHKPS